MRAKQFLEAALGTSPKRPSREGSRPERGHAPQQRYVTDRKTGKQYNPEEEFDKLKNSPDFQAQMKRMATKETHSEYCDACDRPADECVCDETNKSPDELDQYDKDGLQGYYSDFHKDLHGFRPRHHSEEEWNDPETLKNLIRGLHKYMDALKATPEGRAQLKADGWHIEDDTNETHQGISAEQETKFHSKLDNLVHDTFGKRKDELEESKTQKQEAPKPRNFVAKNAIQSGAGAHKDKKKADKQGDVKHKAQAIPLDEVMAELERQFNEEKAPRALCISSKPDEDLGASQLASCKSQGLRARDGNKSHKLGKSPKSRIKVGGHRIKGNKYGGPLPDWS